MGAEPEDAPRSAGAAAVMIQKTYRGYRARRKLADAAIMSKSVGVGWWNVVDSVVLREHTLHYFAHSKSWKPHDNWKRLKRKASKVGKGLEKDNKALKLALQHWLEAVDARHRYGHNLRPYYLHWRELETIEPFFYWLDLGAGRHVELPKCTRATLLDQQITYLSPEQRRHYEVSIYKGKLFYKLSGELVHTGTAKNGRWIFVLSPHGRFYIGKKVKGVFQHSSFLAGGATTAAGRLIVEHGVLKLMEAHSGHYQPSPENFEALVHVLIASGADLHLAKVQLVSDDVLEEKEAAKKLAQEVRQGIEQAGAEAHVGVTIHNQKLITVDHSGSLDGLSEYLVTNLTFPEFTESVKAQKRAEEEEEEANTRPVQSKNDVQATANFTKNGASVPDQSQIRVKYETSAVPDQSQITDNYEATVPGKPPIDQISVQEDDHKEIPAVSLEKLTGPTSAPALTSTSNSVSAPAPASVSTSDSSASVSGPGSTILKKKPGALVLPSVGAMCNTNPNIPRTPTIPTSPGFSRNAILAVSTPQERRHTLKTYGPKKSQFSPTPKKK